MTMSKETLERKEGIRYMVNKRLISMAAFSFFLMWVLGFVYQFWDPSFGGMSPVIGILGAIFGLLTVLSIMLVLLINRSDFCDVEGGED